MNCIIVDDDEMSRNAITHLVSQIPYLNMVGVCADAAEVLKALKEKNVDLMLLDIELPGISGIDLIKSLKKPPLTILVTSKKEYALEAFEYSVIDYLVKPIPVDRFFKSMEKARDVFENYKKNIVSLGKEHLFVKVNGALVNINMKDILWIEALGDYISINTAEKKHTIHSTMKSIESKLSSEKFVRVHRSYIVSIDNIGSIDDNTIVINKQLIPVGYVYKENLLKQLNLL